MIVQENHGHIIEPCFIVNHGKPLFYNNGQTMINHCQN